MADVDISSLIMPSAETGVQVSSAQTGVDPSVVANILGNMNSAYAGVMKTIQNAQALDDNITAQRQKVLSDAAAESQQAGTAAAEVATQQGKADLETQQANQATQQITGMNPNDPTSTLRQSINTFNAAMADAQANLKEARRQEGITFGGIFDGTNTAGEWLHRMFVSGANDAKEKADTSIALAQTANTQIQDLQQIASNQTAINKSVSTAVTLDTIKDNALIAKEQHDRVASMLQDQSLAVGSQNIRETINNAQYQGTSAISMAHTSLIGQSIASRVSGKLETQQDKDSFTRQVQLGLSMVGRADAPTYTYDKISAMMKTPEGKLQMVRLAQIGGTAFVNKQLGSDAPVPNLLGNDIGETSVFINSVGAQPTTGTEPVYSLIQQLRGEVPLTTAQGKALKPSDIAAGVNVHFGNWLSTNSRNTYATQVYGQPPIKAIVARMSSDPAMAGIAKRDLLPLAAAGDVAEPNTVVDAILTDDKISNQQKIAAILSFGRSGTAIIDAVRKPVMFGMPSASRVGLTAPLKTGALLFGTTMPVRLDDEKSVTDYVFKRGLNAKTNPFPLG